MNLNDYSKIIHLSHNDLDGYGCQYLTNLLYKNVTFFNTSYFDVDKNVNNIFKLILDKQNDKVLFLITDVNIDVKTENKINNFRNGNKNLNYDVQVIDHHKTGQDIADRNLDWYSLDTSRCATYLVGQWLLDNNPDINLSKKKYIKFIMEFIDSHDRWLEDHKYHHKANLVSGFIFNKIKYPTLFKDYEREHFFFFLKEAFKYFSNENSTIYDFENNQVILLLSYLEDKLDKNIFEDKNICYEHKLYKYFTKLYTKMNTQTFEIKNIDNVNYKFKLFYELDSNVFQYLSHYYLNENSDKVDFFLNVKSKGSLSFRSKGNIDVEGLAKNYFNGGGHLNAAGGSIKLEPNQKFHSLSDVIEILKVQNNVIELENKDNIGLDLS